MQLLRPLLPQERRTKSDRLIFYNRVVSLSDTVINPFMTGLLGVLISRNMLRTVMSLFIMSIAVVINFVAVWLLL